MVLNRVIACGVIAVFFQTQAERALCEPPPARSCSAMIKNAKALAGKLTDGVEKTAANKEIANGQSALEKGSEEECKAHITNALKAIQAKGTS